MNKDVQSIPLCKFLYWCTGRNQYMCNLTGIFIPVEFQTLCYRCLDCKELDILVNIDILKRRIPQ